jgi:hypothetical protein
MSTNSQPHNGSAVNSDNSEVRAGGGLPARLDTAAAARLSPLLPEGAAIGVAAAPSPSDASVSTPAGGARAVEGECEPFPPVTGSELEAADRALLRAENERLRRLAEAFDREAMRSVIWRTRPVSMSYPWVTRSLNCERPMYIYNYLKLNRQVAEEFAELKRKQLERKQGQDKEG